VVEDTSVELKILLLYIGALETLLHIRWVKKVPIILACIILMTMSGNGHVASIVLVIMETNWCVNIQINTRFMLSVV